MMHAVKTYELRRDLECNVIRNRDDSNDDEKLCHRRG